jgi:hypothetical protein
MISLSSQYFVKYCEMFRYILKLKFLAKLVTIQLQVDKNLLYLYQLPYQPLKRNHYAGVKIADIVQVQDLRNRTCNYFVRISSYMQ